MPPRDIPRVEPAADNERRLAEGLIAGSPEAIGSFLERAHHAVFCMACRLTGDRELRKDWAHAVLLAILEDLERGRFVYRHPGSFWAWFRKRAHYRLLDEYRRHRRHPASGHVEGEPLPPDFLAASGIGDPALELERVELLAAVEACLERVANADQRRALWLLLVEDLSYEGIAGAMGAPLNTVRAWIRRGRLVLRQCLAKRLGLGVRAPSDA